MSTARQSIAELAAAGPIPPHKLSHIVLRSANTVKMRAWYLTVLAAQIAFEGDGVSLSDLLGTYRRLNGLGIKPYWTINHGPTISFYYYDPDRNRVELQFDVFETAAGADEFIRKHYQSNFIGIVIDPEEMIAKYEQGAPMEDLLHRPELPPGKTAWDMHRQ